jgi:hypothetical protein
MHEIRTAACMRLAAVNLSSTLRAALKGMGHDAR